MQTGQAGRLSIWELYWLKNNMFYTVYKITNKLNRKIYIGIHKTSILNDGYMGSGKYLRRAINKYGIENFEKEILFVYDNPDEMFEKEANIVTEKFIQDKTNYNLKIGGFGGWDYARKKLRYLWNNDAEYRLNHSVALKESFKNPRYRKQKSHLMQRLNKSAGGNMFKGKKHTTESKQKMRCSDKGKQKGNKNSQYGTMWITDGKINKKIKKEDNIPEGFRKGRIL